MRLKMKGLRWQLPQILAKAREFAATEDFDLILLDIMLPDGTGYEFCKEIRRKTDKPVIFLTACDDEVNVVMGLDMGGDDYITKPFRVRELVSRIKLFYGGSRDKKMKIPVRFSAVAICSFLYLRAKLERMARIYF